jgi:hypothetical protein
MIDKHITHQSNEKLVKKFTGIKNMVVIVEGVISASTNAIIPRQRSTSTLKHLN